MSGSYLRPSPRRRGQRTIRVPHGRPRIFIAHGKEDDVLPIESTSKKLVSALEDAGYEVTFRLHPGGHVPYPRLQAAWDWFVER